MAAGATFYSNSGMTNALSDGDWSAALDLGTVNIPGAGSADTPGVQVWLKNTGTTALQSISISAVAGAGQTDTVYDNRVSFAPDNAGAPGVWGADGDPFVPADLAAGASVSFWVRTRADSGDTQPANPVKFSLQIDATSV
jgi:hypothetical protein